jgi:transmembrane sensor
MTKEEAHALIVKYTKGYCTPEEKQVVEKYFLQYLDRSEALPDRIQIQKESRVMLRNIRAHMGKPARTARLWPRIAAAAAILVFMSIGGYFLLHKITNQQITQNQQQDLKPGGNKAILTLAGGRKIMLTNAPNGTIATQGSALVTKTDSGKLIYSNNSATGAIAMNTMETPRGGTYYVELADGTKVWLNAASKLVYPSAFSGADREVTLTGEAVFAVKPNKAMPFHVKAEGHTFRDIGTEFNINTYADEPDIKATLLEGSMSADNTILKPGQQADITGAKIKVINNVDTDEVTAWKDGYFQFNEENLESVMRKVSRWYDVDIEFQDARLKTQLFTWRVSRYKTIAPLLRKLELTGAAHFTIENKKIIIHEN